MQFVVVNVLVVLTAIASRLSEGNGAAYLTGVSLGCLAANIIHKVWSWQA